MKEQTENVEGGFPPPTLLVPAGNTAHPPAAAAAAAICSSAYDLNNSFCHHFSEKVEL